MNRKWVPWLIDLGIGLMIFLAVAAYRGVFRENDPATLWGGLSDAFFVPGVLITGVGILALFASQGGYDIFGYAVKTLVERLNPFKKKDFQHYYDYKQEKKEKRKKPGLHVLILGLCFLAAAVVCLVLYSAAGG